MGWAGVRGRMPTALVGGGMAAARRLPGDKGCEPTLVAVLMFWVSEGAEPKGQMPEDTPNARVAE